MVELSSASVFDRYAERYDAWYARNRLIAESEARAVEALGLKGFGLEIGVGSGWFASRIGVDVGVDPAIEMLRLAKKRGIDVVQGVGELLSFRSNVFDYVLVVVTLCFADNPLALLREAWRVVRREGRIGVCIVPLDTPWGVFYEEKKREGHVFYSVARFYTLSEVIEMLENTGFTVEGYVGVLSYSPFEKPRLEEPRWGLKAGFTCIRAVKP